MNGKFYIWIFVLIALLNACMIEEAKPSAYQKVVVYTDSSTPKDSLILKKIYKNTGIDAVIIYKPLAEIAKKIQQNRYNTGFDCLILSSDSLRKALVKTSLFADLSDVKLNKSVYRQFYNTPNFWIPISHDPLIYTAPRDSMNVCGKLSWEKWRRDSLLIPLKISKNNTFYTDLLAKKRKFSFLTKSNSFKEKNAFVSVLSDLAVRSKKDPKFKKTHCFYYLVENQKYLTNFTSVGVYKYSQNKELSTRFLKAFCNYRYTLAANRNQLSTFKQTASSSIIRQLSIQ